MGSGMCTCKESSTEKRLEATQFSTLCYQKDEGPVASCCQERSTCPRTSDVPNELAVNLNNFALHNQSHHRNSIRSFKQVQPGLGPTSNSVKCLSPLSDESVRSQKPELGPLSSEEEAPGLNEKGIRVGSPAKTKALKPVALAASPEDVIEECREELENATEPEGFAALASHALRPAAVPSDDPRLMKPKEDTKKNADVQPSVLIEDILSADNDKVLYEGSLLVCRSGTNYGHPERWGQVTKQEFRYYKTEPKGGKSPSKPLYKIPLNTIECAKLIEDHLPNYQARPKGYTMFVLLVRQKTSSRQHTCETCARLGLGGYRSASSVNLTQQGLTSRRSSRSDLLGETAKGSLHKVSSKELMTPQKRPQFRDSLSSKPASARVSPRSCRNSLIESCVVHEHCQEVYLATKKKEGAEKWVRMVNLLIRGPGNEAKQ